MHATATAAVRAGNKQLRVHQLPAQELEEDLLTPNAAPHAGVCWAVLRVLCWVVGWPAAGEVSMVVGAC